MMDNCISVPRIIPSVPKTFVSYPKCAVIHMYRGWHGNRTQILPPRTEYKEPTGNLSGKGSLQEPAGSNQRCTSTANPKAPCADGPGGIDGTEELDDLNEKIKDMQFKVSKKDKRKTKIED